MRKILYITACLMICGLANRALAGCNAANAVDGEIEVWRGGIKLSNNDIVYILTTPALPTLTAKLTGSPEDVDVEWTLSQEYEHGNAPDGPDYGPETQSATEDWDINAALGSSFIGGKITVKLKDDDVECPFVFHIRGINPTASTVYEYIGTSPWYLIPMVKTESTTRQFDSGTASATDFEAKCPLKSGDNGWGLFQLTLPEPTFEQLWNWKANVDEGKSRMVGFYEKADQWMNDLTDNGITENPGQRVQARESIVNGVGVDVPIDDDTYGNVTFSDDPGAEYTFEDGVAIKLYNGGKGFYSWNDTPSTGPERWKRNGTDYITAVCAQVE